MSDDLIPFLFEGEKLVRVVAHDGEPWFVAIDVAAILGYAKPEGAISRHCRKPVTCPLETGGQVRQVNLISEPDVWRLIIKSNLPDAQRIEEWLFEEVLPSIRKAGGYQMSRDDGAATSSASTPDAMKVQPIPVQLRWVDEVKGVFGVDAAREAYMETSRFVWSWPPAALASWRSTLPSVQSPRWRRCAAAALPRKRFPVSMRRPAAG